MKFLLFMLLLVYSILFGGLLVENFWGWFIVPVFTTLPVLTFSQSVGISTFISMCNSLGMMGVTNKEEEEGERILSMITLPPLLLGIGYLIYLFIN